MHASQISEHCNVHSLSDLKKKIDSDQAAKTTRPYDEWFYDLRLKYPTTRMQVESKQLVVQRYKLVAKEREPYTLLHRLSTRGKRVLSEECSMLAPGRDLDRVKCLPDMPISQAVNLNKLPSGLPSVAAPVPVRWWFDLSGPRRGLRVKTPAYNNHLWSSDDGRRLSPAFLM
ncbi:hypothetical protein ElyMa_004898000 [Elysia marginata]|uniref:Uncharacterized protein n=1 Tax=Elysia marginata TaxID=1093978 RepID=A0AAV4IWA5_9GAST|nr:hypothetical protein ElyMa_004898000 [Elysia marginata]